MNNKTKLIIIVTTLFLSAATHNLQANFFDNTQKTESGTSGDNESDNSTGGFFESENSNTMNRAAPTGDEGDAQKMPISDGIWILMGLAVSYGLIKLTKHRILKK
jgi:hypothetical protein